MKNFWMLIKKNFSFLIKYYHYHFLLITIFTIFLLFFLPVLKKNTATLVKHNFEESKIYSAQWFQYLTPPTTNPYLGGYFKDRWNDFFVTNQNDTTEHSIYLGYTVLILSIIGIFYCLLKRKLNYFSILLFLVGIIALYCSFSPTINLGVISLKTPVELLHKYIPYLRVFSRFSILVYLSLAVAAAYSIVYLSQKKISPLSKNIILLVVVLLISYEYYISTNVMIVFKDAMPKTYYFLMDQGKGPLAEYPLLPREEPKSYHYLLWQRYHQMPLVYGAPMNSESEQFRKTILNPADEKTILRLKNLGVKYLIIHQNLYTKENAKKYPEEYNYGQIPKIDTDKLELRQKFDNDLVYQIK